MLARRMTKLLVLAATATAAFAQSTATMPPHGSSFIGNTRGYLFTAPADMRITGVQVLQPPDMTNTHQNWAIVRFHGNAPPPVYSATTNAFDQLAMGLDQSAYTFAPTSVDILAGELIGIYGTTGPPATTLGMNSYTGESPPTTTIFGTSVALIRSGMQFHLGSATSPQGMHDIWMLPNTTQIGRVEFQYEPLGPTTYCTAKTTSSGCVPAMGFSGVPSPAGNFTATCAQVEVNQLGVLFYGTNGGAAIAFQGGTLCVAPPVIRLPFTSSGGAAVCTGSYSRDLTAVISGLPTGQQVHCQFWFRDPADPFGTGLSNGLTFVTQ